MTMLLPLALGIAAALVYLASSSAKVSELARLVFFACAVALVWRVLSTWVRL